MQDSRGVPRSAARALVVVVSVVVVTAALVAPAAGVSGKQLRVATNLPAPGFFNGNTVGSLDGGFEWAMAQEIAERLGYSGVKYSNVSFDALVAGKAKGFDVAFSQVTITKARAKVVDFTVPYFDSDQGILVKAGTTVDESNLRTIRWGVQTATTAQTFLAKKIKPTQKPRSYQETSQSFAALQAGQIDAVLLDTAIVLAQATQSDGAFEVVGQFSVGEQYGGVLPKGSKLKKKIDAAIEAMKDDGTLSALADEWLVPEFGQDPQKVPYLQP